MSFLEDITGGQALDWATAQSAATDQAVAGMGDVAGLSRRLLSMMTSADKIAWPTRRGEMIYNFWRDETHPKGVWRRTGRQDWLAGDPEWEILLDIDALSSTDGENWVWRGAHVRRPDCDRALVRLSRGGGDAVVIREFDLDSLCFVTDDPFDVPAAKTSVSWVDRDTLLIGTDTGTGSVTPAGYPARIHLWRRGTALADSPVFTEATTGDLVVSAAADTHPDYPGRVFVYRQIGFFTSETYVGDLAGTLTRIPVPHDCEVSVFGDRAVLMPRTAYAGIPAGGAGLVSLSGLLAGTGTPRVIADPGPGEAFQGVCFTAHYIVVAMLHNVSGCLRVIDPDQPGLEQRQLSLPAAARVSAWAGDACVDDELFVTTESFLTPVDLHRFDLADGGGGQVVRHSPGWFDTAGMTTRQHWATSADGTRIPYFITGRLVTDDRGRPVPQPTLVGAYGGFEHSLLPAYSPGSGMAWLDKGFLSVQATIRGGAEFGPDWHSTVTGINRHKVFEDHQAVLDDIVRRGYTTPAQIGVRGGSNGGLLAAVALTLYPEKFGAAVIQVPLTDMLRYHTWLAGSSWIDEYGNPDDPDDCAALAAYSPLQHVAGRAERSYPPALVTTSTKDDRVHPAHARLFAAALQAAGQPVLYRETTDGGHGGATGPAQAARLEAVIFTWLTHTLTTSDKGDTA
ncbi:prolyl oligopeptidase family protein [Corynebacterium mendelii]|uniref:S9 family peptidase n=1 Tax=Corynebacterium mendelii TaxID=2765362 RepID=A0A939ITF8_9CORY|nr:prolyl oligopeptidase family serine peptidase [Corynebacterium mendelii]MBN9643804.1 S9 family peptidase [Corynebacterium mendelii]